MQPSAPDLAFLTPDATSIFFAISGTAIVILTITIAIQAHKIIKRMLAAEARVREYESYDD